MGTGYVRNDTGNNIADGNVINASDLDGEFDAVQAAFNGSTGHSHDGTTGEGPQIDTAGIADSAVETAKINNGAVTTDKLGADAVTGAKIGDDQIDSEHYVAGSIDREHLAADIIDGTKIADDVIDSEHYVAGSIDNEHLADDAVTGAKIDSTTTVTAASFVGPLTGAVTGNASTATTLQTARTIGGVSFNGSANINLPGVNTAGNQDTSGNAATATAWATGRTISLTGDVTGTSGSFDGTANLSFATSLASDSVGSAEIASNAVSADELNVTGNGTTSQFLRSDGDGSFTWAVPTDTNTTYSAGSGLDLSGTTFSVEPDLRDGITHVGLDSGDYIGWTNNSHTSFFVNGNEEARLEADGDFHADGDLIAYSTTISDERLKTNIVGIENAVSKVSQLNGYTFEYKADGKISAGVIAQEVEAVLPEAVTEKLLPLKTDDGQEYKVVNYDALHGLLIEAVKELSARVEELEAK